MVGGLAELAVCLDHQRDRGCFHRDLDEVEVDLLEVGDLLQRRLDHRFRCDLAAVLVVQGWIERAAVHPDTDRNTPVLGLARDGLDVLGLADIARIEPKAVYAGLECFECTSVLVMDVSDDRHRRTRHDTGESFRRLGLVARATHDVAAGCGQPVDLLQGRLVIRRLGDRHRLDRDGGTSADRDVTDHDLSGLPAREALRELHEPNATGPTRPRR